MPAAAMTRAAGRRFAWTLAAAFAAPAVIALWRQHERTAVVLETFAALALVAGIVAPTRLGTAQRAWATLGKSLSRLTTPIVFGVAYLLIVTPAGWVRRTAGRSPLARSRNTNSFWVRRTPRTLDEARAGLEHLF